MHLRPILLIVILGLGITSTAFAQSTAEAEGLFREGKRLMAEKKYAEACAAFEASQNKDPQPSTTLVNLADCREKNGQIASAWGLFLEVERQIRGDKKQKALSKTAKERAGKLEARVSYLIINVPDESRVDGLVITRNGEPVDELTWNRALPIDGGTYLIAGKAPGHEEWTTSVTVDAEKDKQSVDVPKFKSLPVTVEDPKEPDDKTPDEKRLPDDEEPAPGGGGMSGKRKAAIGVGVVGVLALGVAGYFELDARDLYEQSTAETDDDRQQALFDDAVASRKLAIGTAIGGGVCVGVAAFLWFTGGSTSRDESDEQGLRVLPTVGPDGFGLAFSGGY